MAGVGKLDIGVGEGGATVFNPNPAIQQYAGMLQQKQTKHDAEVKMLGDELAKGYDPSVLRNDADRSSYIKKYNDIKKSAIDAENEKDNTKKALALAQVRQQLTDLGSWAEGSKKQGAFERQVAMQHFQNRYLLDDNSATKLKDQMSKTWDSPDVVKDVSGFERGVNPATVDAEYQKHKEMILKTSPITYDNGTLSPVQNILGKKTATLTQNRVIPFQYAYEHTLNYAQSDDNYQKYLHDKYPQVNTGNPKTDLALRVKQDMTDRGDLNGFYDKPKTKEVEGYKPQDPVRPSFDDIQYFKKYGVWPVKGDATANNNTPIYRQKWVGDILSGDKDAFQQIKTKVDASSNFNGSADIGHGTKGSIKGQLYIDIPSQGAYKDGEWAEKVPAHRVFIDPKDKHADVRLNEILNNLTGEKVDISQLETPGGKKHIGAQSYKASDGKSYSHKQLLDLGYTEQQIEEAKKLGTLK